MISVLSTTSPFFLHLRQHPRHVVPDSCVVKQTLDLAHCADSNVLVPQLPLGKAHDVLGGDAVNGPLNLLWAQSPASGDDLASNVLRDSRGAVQGQQNRSLQLGLRTLNLGIADLEGETRPLTESEVDKVVNAGEVVRYQVDTPKTGVGVGGAEGHEGVGELVLVHEGAELAAKVRRVAHSTVPVANNSLSDKGSEVVVILPADTLDGDRNVSSRHRVVSYPDLRANEVRLSLQTTHSGRWLRVGVLLRHLGEVLLGQLDELLVRDTTSADQHHAVSSVVGLDVVLKVVALDRLDVLLGAQDGAAERLVLEGGRVQVVEDNLLHLLVHLLLLTQDDVSLTLDSGWLELGVLQDVGEDVDGGGNVGVERLGVIDGVLTGGVGVEVTAHVLDLELELVLGTLLSTLEGQVLEEVGGAIGAVSLGARAGIYPDADGGCRVSVLIRQLVSKEMGRVHTSLRVGGVLSRDLVTSSPSASISCIHSITITPYREAVGEGGALHARLADWGRKGPPGGSSNGGLDGALEALGEASPEAPRNCGGHPRVDLGGRRERESGSGGDK